MFSVIKVRHVVTIGAFSFAVQTLRLHLMFTAVLEAKDFKIVTHVNKL